jgi:hypothetical protein
MSGQAAKKFEKLTPATPVATPHRTVDLEIDSTAVIKKIFYVALAIEIALVFFDATINVGKWLPFTPIQRLMNMAREDALSAWLSSAQTLVVGFVLLGIYFVSRARQERASVSRGWALLSGFFIYLAVDDGSGLHERIGSSAKQLKEMLDPGGAASFYPSYPWQLILGPFLFAIGLFMLRFILKEFKDHRHRLIFIAALSCYVLAVGQDFIEGINEGQLYLTWANSLGTELQTIRHFGKVFEEFLEIFGTTLFLVAFLAHFFGMAREMKLKIRQ